MVDLYRERLALYGRGRPEQVIVGLGGWILAAESETEVIERYTPYPRNTYVYQRASLGEMTQHTPLVVGASEQIVEKHLTHRDVIDDCRRQALNLDLGSVPHRGIMRQIEYLGFEIVLVPRAELESTEPEGILNASFCPYHRILLEGTGLPTKEPFSLLSEFDPLTGRKVRI